MVDKYLSGNEKVGSVKILVRRAYSHLCRMHRFCFFLIKITQVALEFLCIALHHISTINHIIHGIQVFGDVIILTYRHVTIYKQ